MADSVTVSVRGLRELIDDLERVDDRLQKRILRRALTAGARVIKRTTKAAAPVRQTGFIKRIGSSDLPRGPGFLKRRIIYRKVRGEDRVTVGPSPGAFYGYILNTGVPGRLAATQWLEGVADMSEGPAFRAFAAELGKQLDKELKRGAA